MSTPAATKKTKAKAADERKTRESWGSATKLPSGRYRARYTGPDLDMHNAPHTFEDLDTARDWLRSERRMVEAGAWAAPHVRALREAESTGQTLREYADVWLPLRRNPKTGQELKPRTRAHYRKLLDQKILVPLGDVPLRSITEDMVEEWYASLNPKTPTRRAHAYSLLKTIMGTAVLKKKADSNPCTIEGGGISPDPVIEIVPATADELARIVGRIPKRYRALVLTAVWCSLRYGELIDLRSGDVNLKTGTISVRQAAGKIPSLDGEPNTMVWVVGDPKSRAGQRTLALPPFMVPILHEHMAEFSQRGKDGLVFPAARGKHMEHGGFHKTWDAARRAAERPDLRFHDLRHTGAVLAAQNGATLKELMHRLGHATPDMALRYQHVAKGRDAELAGKLSEMALAGNF